MFENIRDKLWSTLLEYLERQTIDALDKCITNKDDIDDDIEALLLNNLKCSIVLSNPTNIKITYIKLKLRKGLL